ncbi:hypothetical protein SELMODRAFT_150199 [Selaginella moellendorffii]|uniref:Phospholipid/glycerol acyltransferase domain-containing protein n=1 Tax=Selaginella moellendorffii TaxID=88036 RepID=D8RV51_SELML|nr:lysophospholipid acyltransferase LPEAT2 isoform X3 [Selaginella moellendorffii]EFJ23899.1 hypothetical protein SELMODRAFT_150199 [Selaginella moellendorffii]|eukprot:XP_002975114.1 lysophospholipid acyltransferase LPEAT2 isoform X3 [Selaginella moellendorffii]
MGAIDVLSRPLLLDDRLHDHDSVNPSLGCPSSSRFEEEGNSTDMCVVDVQDSGRSAVSSANSKVKWWSAWEFKDLPPLPASSPVDPFRNSSYKFGGAWEVFKAVLCSPLLVVRVILIGVFLFLGFLCTKLALWRWESDHKAMPRWRRDIMWGTRVCARGILFCFGFHWIQRIGRPAPREVAPILVSNHVSFIDPMFYFFELFPTIVSSSSHNDRLFVGTIIRSMQVIPVDRLSPASRKSAIAEIKRRAMCSDFPRLLLFPEATTTNGKALISFKPGAFVPGFPIQPVVVRYPHVHFDLSWGNISLKSLIPRMLLQFHNFMQVHYLPVIYPSSHEKSHPADYAQRVRYAMARSLNVPETEHSYGDLLLSARSLSLKMPFSTSFTLEMRKMDTQLQLTDADALYYLEKFSIMNSSRSGQLTRFEFLQSLGLTHSPFGEQAFAMFDRKKHEFVTFQEFVAASVSLSRNASFLKLLDLTFCHAVHKNSNEMLLMDKVATLLERNCAGSTSKVLVDQFCKQTDRMDHATFCLYLKRNPELIFPLSLVILSLNEE